MRSRSPAAAARAFSVVELLLALAICATLLTAVTLSVRAMTNTVNVNEWYARLTLKGRNVMVRLIDQARTADSHGPKTTSGTAYDPNYLKNGQTMTDIGIQFADAGSAGPDSPSPATVYAYWWDSTKQQLLVQTSIGNVVQASGVMLDGVTNFQVILWPGKSNPQNTTYDVVLRATFLLTYKDTDPSVNVPQTVTLTGSVVPRKNVWSGRKLAYPLNDMLNNNH